MPVEPDLAAKTLQRIARLERDAAQIREWLATYPADRRSAEGAIRQRNRTDNQSAKMATGRGAIQGYTGVAAVDSTHQIIVETQAHSTGSEELLIPVVTAMQGLLAQQSIITTDAGYHSAANLQQLATMQVTALIADNDMRRRDGRFATQDRYKATPDPLYDRSLGEKRASTFQPSDFLYDAEARTGVCPAGKSLHRKGRNLVTNGFVSDTFAARNAIACRARSVRGTCVRPTRRPRDKSLFSVAEPQVHQKRIQPV